MDKLPRPSEVVCYQVNIIGEDPTYHWSKEEAVLMLWSHYMSEQVYDDDATGIVCDWEELITEGSIEDYGIIRENKIPCRNWFTPKGAPGMVIKHNLY